MGGLAGLLFRHRLLRRHPGRLRRVERALIVRLLLVTPALLLTVAEQEFDEAAAQIRAFGIGNTLLYGLRRTLIGINDGRFGREDGLRLSRNGLLHSEAKKRRDREEREGQVFEHRRTLYCFAVARPIARLHTSDLNSKPHRFGKRNRRFDSPRRQCGLVLSGSVYFR